MDPLKIILFAAAFVVLLVLGRLFSRMGEVHAASLPHPQTQPGTNEPPRLAPVAADETDKTPVIGSEIAFPIQIPPVKQRADGTYNRPEILNYYFEKTDLLRGPANPDSLFDVLVVETVDPGNSYRINYGYTVATPTGLQRTMADEKQPSLYLHSMPVIIVPRWDLAVILQTVVDEIMKTYGLPQDEADAPQEISPPDQPVV